MEAKQEPDSQRDSTTSHVPGDGRKPAGWGSFHSEREDERVEVLIAKSDAEYRPPNPPIDISVDSYPVAVPSGVDLPLSLAHRKKVEFGLAAKKELFFLDESFVFLNHGAFGASLKPVIDVARRWQTHMESQPLRFIDRQLLPLLVHVTRQMASFIGADAQDIVLLHNVTTGLNTIFRSIDMREGDRVMTLDIGYGSTKKMLTYNCGVKGAVHDELPIALPISSSQQIVKQVERYLKKHVIEDTNDPASSSPSSSSQRRSHVRLAVFDYITSNTGIVLPITELISVCNKYGVPTLIDGAHSLGSMPLNMKTMKPTYFLANAHKWLCSAKGCAVMYVDRSEQDKIIPLTISHGYGGGYLSNFIWSGLQDYGPWLSLQTTLQFWKESGPMRIRQYIHSLVSHATDLLLEKWGTETLAPRDMYACMATIRVPGPRVPSSGNEMNELQDALYFQYNIECPVKLLQNRLYVRISGHIHNDIKEYEILADAMLKLRPRLSDEDDKKDEEFARNAENVCPLTGCG